MIINDNLQKEDKIILKQLTGIIKKQAIGNTGFLDNYQYNLVINFLTKNKVSFNEFKCNEMCDKKILFFNTDGTEHIRVIKIEPKLKNKLIHKDYMGAIYNSGLKENRIGDIIVKNDCGYVIMLSDSFEYLYHTLTEVGNVSVKTKLIEIDELDMNKNLIDKTITANSLRYDLIISKVFGLSRNDSIKIIENKQLYVNSILTKNIVKEIKIGDIVSLTKFGKFKVDNFSLNKKNKYVVSISLYG